MKFSPGAALARAGHVWIGGFVRFTAIVAIIRIPLIVRAFWDAPGALRPPLDWFGFDLVVLAAVTFDVCARLEGHRPTVLRSIAGALARILQLAGILLVAFLLVVGAALLLAVLNSLALASVAAVLLAYPLFHIVVVSLLAIPAAVVEPGSTLAAFERSGERTQGRRLVVFATLFPVWVAFVAGRFAVATLGGGPAEPGLLWLGAGLRWLLIVPAAVATAVVYHDLRPVPSVDAVAAVFD